MKKALITGITGQDGSYLAELLAFKGYEVHGIVRRTSTTERTRIEHLLPFQPGGIRKIYLHYGDLANSGLLMQLINEVRPDEIYNLGAQSHVRISFDIPEYSCDIGGSAVIRLLDAIKSAGLTKNCRFYQASSSEMFGKVQEVPQTEETKFWPRSPYACAKAFAYWATVNYRESYGMHASNGILFNHESPRRSEAFVTRKITRAATRIKCGLQSDLHLGNLDARRDWGYAQEYVEVMWLMLQQETPDDYVVATNESHSVHEFCEEAFGLVGLDWRKYVRHDERYERPSEVDLLLGNPAKAKRLLGWEPKVRFKDLVRIMVEHDLKLAEKEAELAEFYRRSSPGGRRLAEFS
ncbi:MAG: GDP-mannose 4,6-dehydratase [Verrucomicrobia bacterium]|nr:GDP-mannose 4,6-dehydratase [Verrucomicrobiota bacterium]